MGLGASEAAKRYLRGLYLEEAAGYLLLKLPTEEYAAFWHQGVDTEFADSVLLGRYSEACAIVGSLSEVALFIKESADNSIIQDPGMSFAFEIPPNGLIGTAIRQARTHPATALKREINSVEHRGIKTSCPIVRQAVFNAYSGKCFYTGSEISFDNFHIDHLIPTSKGGANAFTNYVAARPDINLSKGDFLDRDADSFVATQYLVQNKFAPRAIKIYNALMSARTEGRRKKEPRLIDRTHAEETGFSLHERQLALIEFLRMVSECCVAKCALSNPFSLPHYKMLILKADFSESPYALRAFERRDNGYGSCEDISVTTLYQNPIMFVQVGWRWSPARQDELERRAVFLLDDLYSLKHDDPLVLQERNASFLKFFLTLSKLLTEFSHICLHVPIIFG